MVNMIARVVVAGFCVIGLFGIVPITIQHAKGIETCPVLGIVPACYVVTLAYTLTGASMIFGARLRSALFMAGWMPVFGLALLGSSMQVLGNEACPRHLRDKLHRNRGRGH